MARVTVANQDGDLLSGAAFHIGGGLLLTARHVVEQFEIKEIAPTHSNARIHPVELRRVLTMSDDTADVALLDTDFNVRPMVGYGQSDVVPIGVHLDDWIDDNLTMTSVL